MLKTYLMAGVVLALTVGAAWIGVADAAGSGGNTGSPTVCKTGYVYSKQYGYCVKANAGLLDDKALYAEGNALAKARHYEQALAALHAVANQEDSMVLTMIGYATRKSGDWDAGVAYYDQALALNPRNVNTLEYLGEAYVSKGRLDLAQVQLDKIAAIEGEDSEHYLALAAVMAGDASW